jgi:hypothetical protein
MNKYLLAPILSIGLLFSMFLYGFAQESPKLTATLSSSTPSAKSITAGSQYVDVSKIILTASVGDIYLNGIFLGTDVSGGLSNFTNMYLYDSSDDSLVGVYPNQSENPNLIQFSTVKIANGASKTYLIKGSLSPSANGNVRIGFSGFTFATLEAPTSAGVPIYGNVMTLPGATPTPTPISTPMPSTTPTPASGPTPASRGFTTLAAIGLTEGDTISAGQGSSDPDIYIANEYGYKRLFLNPIIFGFYGHLGGFAGVKTITSSTRDMMVTSGLFRNCETNDTKIYGVEITGEDVATLHWINSTGEQAVADDSEFFKKVFCINSAEFNWYSQGSAYLSVNQIPVYSR